MGGTPVTGKYRMTISRMTVDKLGIKLYDKVSAVLAELLANSYDADATEVTIHLPLNSYLANRRDGVIEDLGLEIRIEDNGHGMTPEEINPYYLKVGIDRRQRPQGGASRELSRPVMGRKGIGKLSPFGICREIEVLSAGGEPGLNVYPVANLIMRYDDIVSEESDGDYHPIVGSSDGETTDRRGTTVILRDFDRRRVPDSQTLFRQLTARFGLERTDWHVTVIDTTNEASRFDLRGDELAIAQLPGTRIAVDDRPVRLEDGTGLPVKGWIAYAKDAYKDEVMAGVRIYARGKIVSQTRDFNIPSGFTGEFKLRSYLVGHMTADWIDDDEDLIRSDRQDIIWNSDKGEAFQKWGQELLRELAARAEASVKSAVWEAFVAASGIREKSRRAFPGNREFQDRVEDVAKLAIRGADRDAISDRDYVANVVAFALSVAPHRALLDDLREIAADTTKTLDTVVALFAKVQVAERYSLGQVARERVGSVRQLQSLIDTATTERPLQELLEHAPWLIAPAWTPILMDRPLEEFRRNFEGWYNREYGTALQTTAIGCPTKEPDFIFVNTAQGLDIVEIKKPAHSLTSEEFERAYGYLDAVDRFLEGNPEIKARFPRTRLIIVCDSLSCRASDRQLIKEAENICHRPWRTVLQDTLEAHSDFLRAADMLLAVSEATRPADEQAE